MVSYEEAMSLAIKLARKGIGLVSPNPLVGAVILKDGEIVASGYHHKLGDIHAEIDAINNAGDIDFSDAVLVVNLEPCSHHGKQPPCANAIVKARFKEVVIGMTDPNPIVAGRGIKIMEGGGISVKTGVLKKECEWLNRVFIKHITTAMPYIVLKNAQSINGAIATKSGDSRWISSKESRTIAHQLRAEYDAVAVGKNTVLSDNPELTVRMVEGRNPYRIVFDTKLSIPENYKLLSDDNLKKTIIITSITQENSKKANHLLAKGIYILFADMNSSETINLEQILRDLYARYKIASVLVEGGATLFNSFLERKLIDEYHVFIAPLIIPEGIGNFRGKYSIEKINESVKLQLINSTKSGTDLHLLYMKQT
jgi:diaminohydroxyphosphoribosylaminopyrimidine deaminase/5-amino-6-(5-phosphoribosylamino)uracil reductase